MSFSLRSVSAVLACLAVTGLVGAFLLISPDASAGRDRPWPAESWLPILVRIQALGYLFETARGVEVKDFVFHHVACLMSAIGAICVLLCARSRASSARDALKSPVIWFALLLLCSVVSSLLAEAPRIAGGGTVLRFIAFAWWWPLAVLLAPAHARRVAAALVAVAVLTAVIALRYRFVRTPGAPLSYPMGNPLFLAAMLLPALMIAGTHALARLWPLLPEVIRRRVRARGIGAMESEAAASRPDYGAGGVRPLAIGLLWLAATVLILIAAKLTGSRSAYLGFGFGVLAAVYLAADRDIRSWLLIIAAIVVGVSLGAMLLYRGDLSRTVLAVVDELSGRSASIRARVEHEWPFAWGMFLKRPLLGAGEGGFSRQVGPMARAAQWDDPMLLKSDSSVWEAYAHNELLETLVSLGLIGTIPLLLALGLTWRAALRAVDGAETRPFERAWIIALAAALIACCCEELTDVALHKPGFAPVALTIWACLWAVLRGRNAAATLAGQSPVAEEPDTGEALKSHGLQGRSTRVDARVTRHEASATPSEPAAQAAETPPAASPRHAFSRTAVPVFAVLLLVMSLAGGAAAWMDASAALAYHAAANEDRSGRGDAAVRLADHATRWRLEPAQNLIAELRSIHFRVRAASRLMTLGEAQYHARIEEICREALDRIARMHRLAPRYLLLHELEGVAATYLADISGKHGAAVEAAAWAQRAREAFRANLRDEPFRVQAVRWLWQADATAAPARRVVWLRDLLRGGEAPKELDEFLRDMGNDLMPAIESLMPAAAQAAMNQQPSAWEDRLAPESFRLAARAAWISGDTVTAVEMAGQAVLLYSRLTLNRSGHPLSRVHAAALHEQVQYSFAVDPTCAADGLQALRRAFLLAEGIDEAGALPDVMGQTRLLLLLYLGDAASAEVQAEKCATEQPAITAASIQAEGYLTLVRQFGLRATERGHEQILKWAGMAAQLDPEQAEAWYCKAVCALRLNRENEATAAVERFRHTETDAARAETALRRLREMFPSSPIWGAATSQPASDDSRQE